MTDKPTKPKRTYSGQPIKCGPCDNPHLVELKSPRLKDGRVVKGTTTSWLCPFCQRIVWP